jgi:hypothetical protein
MRGCLEKDGLFFCLSNKMNAKRLCLHRKNIKKSFIFIILVMK